MLKIGNTISIKKKEYVMPIKHEKRIPFVQIQKNNFKG